MRASSATGMSLVPAETTEIIPLPATFRSRQTRIVPESGKYSASTAISLIAVATALSARVMRTFGDLWRMLKSLLLVLLLLVPAGYSQYPGQYPPGGYPPGQGPRQGPGLPVPRRGKTTTKEQKAAEKTHIIRGVVRTVDAKSLEVEADDERMVTFQIAETAKKPDGLIP